MITMDMFSKKLCSFINRELAGRKKYYDVAGINLEKATACYSEDEAVLLKYFYATMPLRDAVLYTPDIFASYAKHAVYLLNSIDWCKNLPEEVFVHHVAYYRVNSENIEPCREEFYKMLKARIEGKSIEDAVIEINYWCAEHVKYASTDIRTASPITLYKTTEGRCGEESTFTVTALRSVGIPCRQVYTPAWAHCDDNHAWVEVFINGEWKFFGACEPEEVLNTGWFTPAAARALLIHSRNFSKYPEYNSKPAGNNGAVFFYNNTGLYSGIKNLDIKVKMPNGKPAVNIKIALEVFNMASLAPITDLLTNANGTASIDIGKGDVVATIAHNGLCACRIIKADETNCTMQLEKTKLETVLKQALAKETDFLAPPVKQGVGTVQTEEQKKLGEEKLKRANELRENRLKSFFDKERAAIYPEAEQMLYNARGNFNEVFNFLSKDNNNMRLRMLKTLSKKDYADVKAELLNIHYEYALPFKSKLRIGVCSEEVQYGSVAEDIFDKCFLCPRIGFEELTDYREGLFNSFSEKELKNFLQNPLKIAEWINENIAYAEELDYSVVATPPFACVRVKNGSAKSCHILFVAVCRTIGIPARLNPASGLAEYYENNEFIPAWKKAEKASNSKLSLNTKTPADFTYGTTWSIAAKQGNAYTTLDYMGLAFNNAGKIELKLPQGLYRLITSARMPNGNQKLNIEFFALDEVNAKELELFLRHGNLADGLVKVNLPAFKILTADGKELSGKEHFKGKKNALMFLHEGQEPTEHVLNELIEKHNDGGLEYVPIFIVRSAESLKNATLSKVLNLIPEIETYYMPFNSYLEPLARNMFTDHEKLPIIIVTDSEFKGVFAMSGYNVGSVDFIGKLFSIV